MNKTLKEKLEHQFIKEFSANPLLIFSPGRINLIGEHTDYNNGYVFPAAINKGIYVALQKTNKSKSTVIAVDKNELYEFNVQNIIRLKESSWKNYVLGVIAEIQKVGKVIPNFELIFLGDIPDGAGLSSSAALENGIAFGLNKLFDLGFTKQELILISQQAEHNFVGVKCGIMDQYASMFGKENHAVHLDCRSLKADFYKVDLKEYELILINTNIKHSLADSAYNDRRKTCEKVASFLKIETLRDVQKEDLETLNESEISKDDYDKVSYVLEENERTINAAKSLLKGNTMALGNLMYASHKGLSEKYKVSCKELDFLVESAKKSEVVIGARMMGGGFGGCTINLIESTKKELFLEKIRQEYKQEFNIDCTVYSVNLSNGTRII